MTVTQKDFNEELTLLVKTTECIVVEGYKDKKALTSIGVKPQRIITLKKPLYNIIETVLDRGRKVIILTDLDKKGKELYGKINRDCQRFGIKVNNRFREFLFKTQLRQIEGLPRYKERLEYETPKTRYIRTRK